jgi:nucleoside-diphosphate-sugar epimerase
MFPIKQNRSTASAPLPKCDLEHVYVHTQDLWEEARGKSIFITGGTGFFGVWLLETICYVNDRLDLRLKATVLTRYAACFLEKCPHLRKRNELNFIEGDVRNFDFPDGKFSFVIHAATEASAKMNEEEPDKMLSCIIDGTRRVLEFAAQCGVKKMLVTSSGAVYGKQPPNLTHIPENYSGAPDPTLCSSAYGEGKRVSEHLSVVHAKNYGYEVKIARCFAFVGPHLPLDGTFAIGNFIRDALARQPIQVGGDGSPMRSYLYAADLAIWLWTLLFKAPSGIAYNVGSNEDISIRQLAQVVADGVGKGLPVHVAQALDSQRPLLRYVPNVDRAKNDLGLSKTVSLLDAIQRTHDWNFTLK